jgi:glycosyltransferase involved in cell wall biosynthesis
MRIGIDATCWTNPRGYGRFTKDMLTALLALDQENEYLFFIDSIAAPMAEFPPNAHRVIVDMSESPTQAASADGRRGVGDMLKLGRAVSNEQLDIFFYPSVYTYFPIRSPARKIVAIHDVIAEKYPELIFRSWKNKLFWNLKTWLAIRQADLVLTVSQFSRQGIAEHFGISPDIIKVVSEGADDSFGPVTDGQLLRDRLAAHGLSETSRYILYVGGIAPHKNLAALVGAFSRLMNEDGYSDVRLVMVGDYQNDVFLMDEKLKADMDNPAFEQRVIYTGYVTDSDLNCLYNAAQVFVLPSFCEGFGLPALEAMSCGTVVIASNTTSVPEVVGDAGLYFDPANEEELVARLRTVLDDGELRSELEKRSLARAATFSWTKSASETLEVFNALGAAQA